MHLSQRQPVVSLMPMAAKHAGCTGSWQSAQRIHSTSLATTGALPMMPRDGSRGSPIVRGATGTTAVRAVVAVVAMLSVAAAPGCAWSAVTVVDASVASVDGAAVAGAAAPAFFVGASESEPELTDTAPTAAIAAAHKGMRESSESVKTGGDAADATTIAPPPGPFRVPLGASTSSTTTRGGDTRPEPPAWPPPLAAMAPTPGGATCSHMPQAMHREQR